MTRWYSTALALIERLALIEGVLKPELRALLARNFRGLWTSVHMLDELEDLSSRFGAKDFWREGWAACRQTMRFDTHRLTPESSSRLAALEAALRPSNLPERVRAVVLGATLGGLDLEDVDLDRDAASEYERLDMIARQLGAAVATDEAVLAELLPDLLRGGNKVWAFGRGLAGRAKDRRATWGRLVECFTELPPEQRDVQVLRGYLTELWEQDRDLAHDLVEEALDQAALVAFVPLLHSAVQLDGRGADRLKRALRSGQVPVRMYRHLALGQTAGELAGGDLRDLLLLIAEQPDGFDVALEILAMRLYSDCAAQRAYAPDLLDAGRVLLRRVWFRRGNQHDAHSIADVARACLTEPEAGPIAAEVARRLRRAVAAIETYAFDNYDLLNALLSVQPAAVLDALFEGCESEQRTGVGVFDHLHDHQSNPADEISCEALINWCERDRDARYPLAASIVTFARRAEEGGPQVWSEQAKELLAHAPDPRSVLAVFVGRFRPMSWSGSRAAVMETNARLLDSLEAEAPAELMRFLVGAKDQLSREIARVRQSETEQDRDRDERFE